MELLPTSMAAMRIMGGALSHRGRGFRAVS
jgi:hypothetical protein